MREFFVHTTIFYYLNVFGDGYRAWFTPEK